MNFLNLQIVSNARGVLYSSDIEPQVFEGLAKLFASELVHQKVFRDGELFAMRIVPRWTGPPRFDAFEFPDARTLPPLKRAFLDLVFEEAARPDPVQYFTLRWHSADRNLVYQQDLPVKAALEGPIKAAVNRLLGSGQLAEGEKFKYAVFARDQGLPTVDPELLARLPVYTTPIFKPPAQSQGKPDAPKRDFKVAVTGKKSLVTPQTKSPADYDEVEAIRQVVPGALRVFVHRKAWSALREPRELSRERQVEVAGALIGGVFTDDSGQLFAEVEEVLPFPEAQGDTYSVRIDPEIWRGLIEGVNLRYPNRERVLVGWYHTHLVSKLHMKADAEGSGEMQASRQTFLSPDDVFIHDNFFPQPWHVALVLDLITGQDVFFCRRDKKLVDCGGFYLYGALPGEPPQ